MNKKLKALGEVFKKGKMLGSGELLSVYFYPGNIKAFVVSVKIYNEKYKRDEHKYVWGSYEQEIRNLR